VQVYEQALYRFLDTRRPGVLSALAEKKVIDDALRAELDAALREFAQEFAAAGAAA